MSTATTATDTSAVHLTESAAKQITALAGADAASKGLRIFVEAGGCSGMSYGMELNSRQPNDEAFPQHGVQLFIDRGALGYLKGSTIDYVSSLSSAGFRIANPNARHTCGCGTSFEA